MTGIRKHGGPTRPDRRDVLKAAAGGIALAALGPQVGGCGGGGGGGDDAPPETWVLPEKVRCLYNGHLLTAHPSRAMDASSTQDRHRLYVLNAVLIDPATGRIAATYPALGGSGELARPVAEHPTLLADEAPAAPGHTLEQMLDHWRRRGVAEHLLQPVDFVDLQGAVVTPGLIDDHFHITSWSKKLPPEGERFGFYADVGDPHYYVEVAGWGRRPTRAVLWDVVTDASVYLAEREAAGGVPPGDPNGIFLHGYWLADVDDEGTHLFAPGGDCGDAAYDPVYLLNRVGRYPGAVPDPDDAATGGDPADWPALPSEQLPALLVHTSGQGCWFNGAVLEAFNADQVAKATAFVPVRVDSTARDGEDWVLHLQPGTPETAALLAMAPPYTVDVVVGGVLPPPDAHVPFHVTGPGPVANTILGRPVLDHVAETLLEPPAAIRRVVPFYRPLVPCVPHDVWEEAYDWSSRTYDGSRLGSGEWNPQHPYASNWYNGAERGIFQYFRDGDTWKLTGYAEHYVARDTLMYYVLPRITLREAMDRRRRMASWCHQQGLTSVQDIMFYRRSTNQVEFDACRGLSYDHHVAGDGFHAEAGLPDDVKTGGLNLRIGLYYYQENAGEVTRTIAEARDAGGGCDVERLRAPAGHPDGLGWIRWIGWKLQLDGGTGARTLFSSAPMAKPTEDAGLFWADDEGGVSVPFSRHSYGLLTMTNEPEAVFTGRESAALYWLVRDSAGRPPGWLEDWSFLSRTAADWVAPAGDPTVIPDDFHGRLLVDLANLHTILPTVEMRQQFAQRVSDLFTQVQSGWERTLRALVAIWHQASIADAGKAPLPSQVVCHCVGDGAVDLYLKALRQLRDDLAGWPANYVDLPPHWTEVVPLDDFESIQRLFEGQRYRIEHLLNVSTRMLESVRGPDGLDTATTPATRNVVFSTQPSLLLLDGRGLYGSAFRAEDELWDVPHEGAPTYWRGVPAIPRSHHHMPCPMFADADIPFTLNADPPAVRDPRPALTVVAAVARTPVEIDPRYWVGHAQGEPQTTPPAYLVGKVYSPFGLTAATPTNPLRLTVEQALASMTLWSAFVSHQEDEIGVIAAPEDGTSALGWHADLVVWTHNPLAIRGPTDQTLDVVGRTHEQADDAARVGTVNAFLEKFRPAITIVGGAPVYARGAFGDR